MPIKGEYQIDEDAAPRVDGVRRAFGVMFDPASAASRRGIVDSGLRYEVRLTLDGRVEFRTGDLQWEEIVPTDPPNGPPVMLSFNRLRWPGERLPNVRFEMIAVGRGRIMAKERRTGRIFHLVMNHLFKTYPAGSMGAAGRRRSDWAVPGNYFKLDPEFFSTAPPTAPFPIALADSYNQHPAALRFPLFRVLLSSGLLDATVIVQNPREWHLIDARSPLSIIGPEDIQITDQDLRDVLDQATIRGILREFYEKGFGGWSPLAAAQFRAAFDAIVDDSGLDGIRASLATFLSNLSFAAVLFVLNLMSSVVRQTASFFRDWVADNLARVIRQHLFNRTVDRLIDRAARVLSRQIRRGGIGALVVPANVAFLGLLLDLQNEDRPGGPALKPRDGSLQIHPGRLLAALAGGPSSPALQTAMERIKTLARERALRAAGLLNGSTVPAWARTPNSPPPSLPLRRELVYRPVQRGSLHRRFAIGFTRIIDMGVGYSHWSEQHQTQFGGEIHAVLSARAFTQAEGYNSMLYRFLNGPIRDGDAFIDGTTNFYLFVELSRQRNDNGPRFAILWIDEQSYFTQRWRLVHPTADVLGDMLSLQRTLHDTPERFQFDLATFWEPFNDGAVSARSRMLVKRQIIVLTGYDARELRHEIYTICFNYGVCDHTWRWRLFPPGARPRLAGDPPAAGAGRPGSSPVPPASSVTVDAIDLREDGHLVVEGGLFDPAAGLAPVAGLFFQTYLPCDSRHVPDRLALREGMKPAVGYTHPWHFFSAAAYRFADRFYQLGVYETVSDSRCQYYEIDLLPGRRGNLPETGAVTGRVWKNDGSAPGKPLFFNTLNMDFSGLGDGSEFIPITDLFESRSGKETLSMYEPTTRFRLLERAPLGLIAVFDDKRDDDLQSASHLPQQITLEEERDVRIGVPSKPRRIQVLVRRNVRIDHPPVVKAATIGPLTTSAGGEVLPVSFWTPQSEDEVNRNIWKVCLAAFADDGAVVRFFTATRFDHFVRRSRPVQPLPFAFDGILGDEYRHDFDWLVPVPLLPQVRECCTQRGRVLHGTSLWFEDVVGHRATAESLIFL